MSLGNQHSGCPFYGARKLAAKAQLVLAPYQYLLDPPIRKSSKIDLASAVVIFDEVHFSLLLPFSPLILLCRFPLL